jgi:hypothetical protein
MKRNSRTCSAYNEHQLGYLFDLYFNRLRGLERLLTGLQLSDPALGASAIARRKLASMFSTKKEADRGYEMTEKRATT